MKYVGWTLLSFCVVLSILCFIPTSKEKKYFSGYDKIKNMEKENIEKMEQEEKEKATEKEEKIVTELDTMELTRKLKDVVNSYFNALKEAKFDEANKYLITKGDETEDSELQKRLDENLEYTFFKNYLKSYQITIKDSIEDEEGAIVNIVIRRYDINKLAEKLAEKQIENEEFLNATYEELLFEYEKYFRDEFMKTNVLTIEEEYSIKMIKEDDKWKILNDVEFTNAIVNLQFKINKNYVPGKNNGI